MGEELMNKHQTKRNQSYQRFIEAGYRIFGKRGYEKASIDEIAKEAGYTKGAFYLHFKTKEELFIKLDELRDDQRAQEYKRLFQDSFEQQRSFKETIHRLVDIILEESYKDTHWGLLAIEFLLYNARNEQMQKLNQSKYDNWLDVIRQIIDWGKSTSQLPEQLEPDRTASAVLALYDGYFVHASLYPGKVSAEHFKEGLIRLFQTEQ